MERSVTQCCTVKSKVLVQVTRRSTLTREIHRATTSIPSQTHLCCLELPFWDWLLQTMYFYCMKMNTVDVLQKLTSKDYQKTSSISKDEEYQTIGFLPLSTRQDVRCSSAKSPEASKTTLQTEKKQLSSLMPHFYTPGVTAWRTLPKHITPVKYICTQAHTRRYIYVFIYIYAYTPRMTYTNPAQVLHRNTFPSELEGAYF